MAYRKTRFVQTMLIAGIIIATGHTHAKDLKLANIPLFLAAGVDPNMMLLIDNSGSMHNIVPDVPYDPTLSGLLASLTCPLVNAVNPDHGTIDVRVNSGGTPYFLQGTTVYNWDILPNLFKSGPERCFDPNGRYFARLYAEGTEPDGTKRPVSYLRAQYTGKYLNWYFGSNPTNWGSGARQKPGTKRRMDIAKTAAINLVGVDGFLENARAGLASYNSGDGATINVAVGDLTNDQRSILNTKITELQPGGNTPLAESLHDIGRYFVGIDKSAGEDGYAGSSPLILHSESAPSSMPADAIFNHSPNYLAGVSKASPIKAFCQQNFAVLLTDGRPQGDRFFLGDSDPNLTTTPTLHSQLRDYTGNCLAAGNCLSYGRKPPPREYESAGSDYLDDIAKALYDIDLRPDLDNAQGSEVKNNVRTYTIGFADDQVINDPLMQSTANNGGGLFLQAANADQLADAFEEAAADILEQAESSGSSVAFNSGSARAGAQIYQARFKSIQWSGQLLAYRLHDGTSSGNGCNSGDPIGKLCPTPVWDAGCTLTGGACNGSSPKDGSDRQIITFSTKNSVLDGVPFTRSDSDWGKLASSQQNTLIGGDSDNAAKDRIDYLRGTANATFRSRQSLLGDIVHSSPLYVGPPSRRYPATWTDKLGGSTPESGYAQFKTTYKSRMSMVYAGANDGFLHAFRSGSLNTDGTLSNNDGKELLAYMPSKALAKARNLTNPGYKHDYYVDGTPVENDVFFDDAWHTVMVGGLGAGGQSIYALDITNPDSFSESNAASTVLWEFNDTYNEDGVSGKDLGYTISQPAIVRLHNGKWGVVVGNGYNNTKTKNDDAESTSGNAVLYVLDIEDGDVLAKLDTGAGKADDPTNKQRPNGLASVFPVDKDGDLIADYVYAGDLFGSVWRFNLTSTNKNDWHVSQFGAGSPTPLFAARDGNAEPQPITTQVQVGAHPYGVNWGVMVYFGTGKYLETKDNRPNTSITQTFYGIWDKDFPTDQSSSVSVQTSLSGHKKYGFTRGSNLIQQQIDAQASASGDLFRRVTQNVVTYSTDTSTTKHGWYLDLKLNSDPNQGEMVISDPVLRGKKVVFTTLIPGSQACVAGGTGFLMVLDQVTGGRTAESPFDVSPEYGEFTTADYIPFAGGTAPASGLGITGNSPGFILAADKDRALIQELDGTTTERDLNLGVHVSGRKTWRQLR